MYKKQSLLLICLCSELFLGSLQSTAGDCTDASGNTVTISRDCIGLDFAGVVINFHSIDKLAPTGMSGLTTVSLTDDFNETRPVFSLGFDYALRPNQRISGALQYQELPYLSKTETNAYLNYTIAI
tara:strand:+ start:106 stop:483 length:378 start_codon:yes stop_codon:yes gene_type:complete